MVSCTSSRTSGSLLSQKSDYRSRGELVGLQLGPKLGVELLPGPRQPQGSLSSLNPAPTWRPRLRLRRAQAWVPGWSPGHPEPAEPTLLGYDGPAFLLERLCTAAGRRLSARSSAVSGLPPSPLQSRISASPYPATCGVPKGASGDTARSTAQTMSEGER